MTMDEREMVSADEAQAMLDGVPDLAEVTAAGQDTLSNAVTGGGRYGVAVARAGELLGDMERLARTVIVLHAIAEGRTIAPTDAEIAAHAGAWLMRLYNGALVVMRADGAREARDVMVSDVPYVAHWWPLTSDGRPCAWPEVAQRPAGCICDYPNGQHRFSCARQQPTAQVTRDENGTFRVAGKDVDRG